VKVVTSCARGCQDENQEGGMILVEQIYDHYIVDKSLITMK